MRVWKMRKSFSSFPFLSFSTELLRWFVGWLVLLDPSQGIGDWGCEEKEIQR